MTATLPQNLLGKVYHRVVVEPGDHNDRDDGGGVDVVHLPIGGAFLAAARLNLDSRGSLVEVFRAAWTRHRGGERVAQAYLSTTYADVVKGWHLHREQTDRFACVAGRVVVALYDLRPDGHPSVVEVALSAQYPQLLVIPPGVAHGWSNPGPGDATILNLVSHEYDGSDEYRRPADRGPDVGVDYDWRHRRDG